MMNHVRLALSRGPRRRSAVDVSRTGRRLRIVGFRRDEFEVSEGCDEQPLGGVGRDRCTATVSFAGAVRQRAAVLWVPVNGLSRMVRVIAAE